MESSKPDLTIVSMQVADWPSVARILGQGIATGDATFETQVPGWQEWHRGHLLDCRIVGRCTDEIVGWAALSPVSGRCVYGGVAEVSVYVAEDQRGMGVGRSLLKELVRRSEQAGLWTLQAGIFPENQASVKIHEKAGFRIVGVRQKIGRMGPRWRDVLLLERRSRVVGID